MPGGGGMSWWPFGGGGDTAPPEHEPSVSEHTLADIVRGIQHAVNAAQTLTEQHFVQLLERYIDPKTGKAYVQRIMLPDGIHYIDLPLITAIPPNGLALKEMNVDMAVRIDNSTRKKAAPRDVETQLTRTSFEVSFAPRAQERAPQKTAGSAIDVSMKFVAGDPPEGVARVMEYFTHALVPRVLETGEAASSVDGIPAAADAGAPALSDEDLLLPPAPEPPDNPADEND